MFVDTFKRMLNENNQIPSQNEFVESYFKENAQVILDKITSKQLKLGLKARLRRTYPSLVRDVHFEALLRERGLNVSYNLELDIRAGVDHTIKYRGQTFYIHCYVNTRAGRLGRKIKNRRHDFTGIHVNIELNLGAESSKSVGDFYLYSDHHIDYLIDFMQTEISKK